MVEAAEAHLLFEGVVRGVLDGLHADRESGSDVFGFVIDEEDIFWRSSKAFGGVAVDGGFGFGEVERVGPGAMVEGAEPVVFFEEAGGHGVADVGEDAGADAGVLQTLGELEHGGVGLRPEIDVGGDGVCDLLRSEEDSCSGGGGVPVGVGREVAAIVGVAVRPVFAVEDVFAEACDGADASPGCGIGWAGEDHAVVEEDCLYWIHILKMIVREVAEFTTLR
jgi:hypothetical protein